MIMAKPLFSVETNAKAFTKAMELVAKEVIPKAITETVNTCVKGANSRQIRNVKRAFIVRAEKFTLGSLRIQISKYKPGRSIDRIDATVGSISPYLTIHDEGGTVRAEKDVLAIPTVQSRIGRKKTGRIGGKFKMSQIGGTVGDPGSKFFFMRGISGKLGIFFRRTKKKVVKVRDMSLRSYRIKPTHWHEKAVAYFKKPSTFAKIYLSHGKRIFKSKFGTGKLK